MSLKAIQLGAVKNAQKTKFSVYSQNAKKIELCLFDDSEQKETRHLLKKDENNVWSATLDNIKEGQKYGYRAHGEFNLEKGLAFNPNKLLIDPYAKELSSSITDWENPALLCTNNLDSSHVVPKSIVTFQNKEDDQKAYPYLHKKPNISIEKTIIYEAHVKGISQQHPNIPENMRGKFQALSHDEIINHLKSLNITFVELMPITTTCGGPQLLKSKSLSDYWGYNPINHFALDKRFGSTQEFKDMVSKLHQEGIEVGLDVVYNHTGEFNLELNSISYKGLDSPSYYRFDGSDKSKYLNTTGCGNSFNVNTVAAQKLMEDSLIYWIEEMGIDGFRFDLGGDCAQGIDNKFDKNGAFFATINKIKHRYGVKVFCEPWSASGGYFRGQMGDLLEWNDTSEKTYRRFFKGEHAIAKELAGHISGGEGLSHNAAKTKYVRYVTAHDGFTLKDVVTYNQKNNWANNENNQDGNNNNHSSSSPNDDIAYRRMKSMLASVFLSRGVPMLSGGDELSRSQKGNNNAYCQDNEISWYNWKNLNAYQKEFLLFTKRLSAFRASHPLLSSLDSFSGKDVGNGRKDIEWIRPDGQEMTTSDWDFPYARTLAYVINGRGANVSPNKESYGKIDNDFLIIMSGNESGAVAFNLPKPPNGERWQRVFDTSIKGANDEIDFHKGDEYKIEPYAVAVFSCKKETSTYDNSIINFAHQQKLYNSLRQ